MHWLQLLLTAEVVVCTVLGTFADATCLLVGVQRKLLRV
jgi:hypothetical protein